MGGGDNIFSIAANSRKRRSRHRPLFLERGTKFHDKREQCCAKRAAVVREKAGGERANYMLAHNHTKIGLLQSSH